MTQEPTLESLFGTGDEDDEKTPSYLFVYPPSMPYYLHQAVKDLEKWADALDRIDPFMLDEDDEDQQEIREHLEDIDLPEAARVLRLLADSEEARRLILFRGKAGPGRRQRHTDRDYLVAFEYSLRQRLSVSLQLNREKVDVHATARRWKEWGIGEPTVRKARSKHGKKCRDEIEFQVVKWMEPPHLCSLNHVLAALFHGVLIAQGNVSQD